MRNKKLLGGAAAVLSASLLFAGCGSRTEATTTAGGAATKVAKIGVIAPLSGSLSALGLGIKNSVDLAIREANESNAIPGWKLELAAEDDEAKPDVGKNAATKLSSDNAVVGRRRCPQLLGEPKCDPGAAAGPDRPGLAGEHRSFADHGR